MTRLRRWLALALLAALAVIAWRSCGGEAPDDVPRAEPLPIAHEEVPAAPPLERPPVESAGEPFPDPPPAPAAEAPSPVAVPRPENAADQPRTQLTVGGRVLRSDGTPAARAQVWVRIKTVRSATDLPRPEERSGDYGMTFGSNRDGTATIVRMLRVWTAADGTFESAVPGDGEVLLDVFALGAPRVRTSLGEVRESRSDVEVRLLDAGTADRLQLTAGDAPLRGAAFIASDLETGDGVEAYNDWAAADDDGRVPSEWLVAGHRYRFIVKGKGVPNGRASGFVRWRGQSRIDVSKLSMRQDLE